MEQPQLGRKIAEIRKSKGFTQEELVDKCNLSVRTLQRIESGEVSPRSYTRRLIFTALEYDIHDSNVSRSMKIENFISVLVRGLERHFRNVLDLFNLKTDTMKKLTILTLVLALVIIGVSSLTTKSSAQSIAEVEQIIAAKNADYIRWFNNGQVDSLLTLYSEDACKLPSACGKAALRSFYLTEVARAYTMSEVIIHSLSVCDTIAVEVGSFKILHQSAGEMGGKYISEWHYTNKKWLMVHDISSLD